ncbi:MAG: MBOAT family O-acyltransferase [Polyangiaceae bacterium]|jgi:alginate O-acetyltransferase complex protein AlgI
MIFNEATYYLFFLAPAVGIFHLLARDRRIDLVRLRSYVLSVFGILFFVYYGYSHFGGWKGSAAVGIFIWELITSRLYRRQSKWCLFGIVQSVLILLAFKYLGFLSNIWNDLCGPGALRLRNLPAFGLPLGISFFTFEFIHFAADTYWGRVQRRPPGAYAAFIFFFPTMVAGPIKRFGEFEPELEHARGDPTLFAQGVTRILAGLAKKQVLADTFTLWSDKLNTDALYAASPSQIAVWICAYGMKIYMDFSGYSDVAIGSGYLFGIRIPENFDWPYASRSITEFWRRWHISLGRWIFDYIYVPLGGSRRGEARTALNLLATFAISGLWHGAAYNFLAWGLWHGAMMIVHRVWRRWSRGPKGPFWDVCALAMTFVGVNVGWAFFCMPLPKAIFALARLGGWT